MGCEGHLDDAYRKVTLLAPDGFAVPRTATMFLIAAAEIILLPQKAISVREIIRKRKKIRSENEAKILMYVNVK